MLNEEGKIDSIRQVIDWALEIGRKYQSSQTGLIHFYHHQPHIEIHQTIPIYENVLFALALFRTRTIENIKEGQTILSRIFAFQNSAGNFPVYIDEYPNCRDFLTSVNLLVPFYWILKNFSNVLPPEFRQQLIHCIEKGIECGIENNAKTPFPYSISIRFSATLLAYSKLLNDSKWEKIAHEKLLELSNAIPDICLSVTRYLADFLIAYQLCGDNCPDFIKNSVRHAFELWNTELCCYCGPRIREYYDEDEPFVNLYDLMMGVAFDKFSDRFNRLHIENLYGALIQPFENFCTESVEKIEGIYKDQLWKTVIKKDYFFNLIQKHGHLADGKARIYSPFSIFWRTKEKTSSLVCENCIGAVDWTLKENQIELLYSFDEAFEAGNSEKSREICFFVNFASNVRINLNGLATTTFQFGDNLELSFEENKNIKLKFELIEGSGEFLGHVAMANRPSQKYQGIEKRFDTYDWTIFLRTLRRVDKCLIKVSVDLQDFVCEN